MFSEYFAYLCPVCHKSSIFVADEVNDTIARGKYMSCGHCGFRNLEELDPYSDLVECMNERHYIKLHGAYHQIEPRRKL